MQGAEPNSNPGVPAASSRAPVLCNKRTSASTKAPGAGAASLQAGGVPEALPAAERIPELHLTLCGGRQSPSVRSRLTWVGEPGQAFLPFIPDFHIQLASSPSELVTLAKAIRVP